MKITAKIRRWWNRLYVRIVKEKATPEYIARGWAIGMFYGCLIPFGFQLILSIPTAFRLKGSKIGATLGTLLTNPVSIWFIYPVQCYVGSLLLGGGLDFQAVSEAMKQVLNPDLPWYEAYQALFGLGWKLAGSFFLGGSLLTAVMVPLTYWFVKRTVVRYRELREKRLARRLANAKKTQGQTLPAVKKAFFLDRDGVINVECDYLHDPDQVELIPGTAAALRQIKAAGFLAVVVTNQSGIARGMYSEADTHAVHRRINDLLAPEGTRIDAFYLCPHHPKYSGECSCRKPAPGMLLAAARDLQIDLKRSFMVGDRISDLEAGKSAGCRTSFLVKTGYGANLTNEASAAGFPVVENLLEAVEAARKAMA